ncbi:hypothetical protein [Streptomyces sp. NPDC046685]|uniref:hypothetical protein n=1 Tax=Streptomyces sp. NPDC046685 TaxID=3157202 RepID=UPI0033E6E893
MAGLPTGPEAMSSSPWPWDVPEPRHRWKALGERRIGGSGVSLTLLTTLLLAAGYGWLGTVADGPAGALIGAGAGLAMSAGIFFLVHRAVSGPAPSRRRRASRP